MRLLYRVVKGLSDAPGAEGAFIYPKLEGVKESEKKQETSLEDGREMSVIGESLIQAEKILNAARNEAENIKKGAYEKGFAEGRQTGYDEGFRSGSEEGKRIYAQKAEELGQEVKACIEDVQVKKDKALDVYMDDLKDVAMAVGEKIVMTSLKSDSRVVEKMIVAATDKLRKSTWAKIYVGTGKDAGADIKADPGFLKELEHLSDNVKIIVMEGAEPGTCIVERPEEIIDVSVGTQLENIREIMNNARL